jgi:2-haloacid dehalogenase
MIRSVVFDLGGVLIDWNPRYLYRKLFGGDEAAMEHFLAHVCNNAWNLAQDGGRRWADAIDVLSAEHPHHRPMIAAYRERWEEMLNGPIHGTVDVLAELKDKGVPVYALTNWSAETFPIARERYDFLG